MLPQIWFSGRSREKTPCENKFNFPENERGAPKKPLGGFWTSSYKPRYIESSYSDNPSKWYLCDWHDQGEMMFGDLGDAWLLQPDDDIKYYIINGIDDLKYLWENYYRVDKRFLFMEMPEWEYPLDFEAIFYDYDAILLTEQGQWDTRLTQPLSLYGWDSECVLWGKWKFTYIEKLIKE